MPSRRVVTESLPQPSAASSISPPPYALVMLRVLAVSGYGLWLLLGAGLTLGIYREGRSEALVPLSLGGGFVSLGLLIACTRIWPRVRWHGWQPGPGQRPTRDALLALATYLPMLLVAGLVRGSNDFWATRLAGMALLICSLCSLTYTAWNYRSRLAEDLRRASSTLPLSRVVAAGYSGGLWLWLCVTLQDLDGPSEPGAGHPWTLILLMFALLLGLMEVLRWQSLQPHTFARPATQEIRPGRFVASIFTYALPCAALLLNDQLLPHASLVLAAALSCLVGITIEQRLYDVVMRRTEVRTTR